MDDDGARRAAVDDAVDRFLALVRGGEPDLLDAVLEIARAADPAADVAGARTEIDRLAAGVTDLDGLVRRLYVEEGFHGNRDDYYDPRNSSLTEVLARRTGIPITLAVLCIEVGRRVGIEIEPVGMPGHFLVHPVAALQHLDPFTGEMLDREQCIRRFRESTGLAPEVPFDDAVLEPIGTEAVLVRMLTNLRGIHRARGDLAELGWVLRMRLGLPGVSAVEVAELAEVRGRRAAFREAADLLEEWAEVLPRDAEPLRRHARRWRAHLN
ncbi:SirB1 family protein [Actinomycetospora lemnae]|uniref:Transglutaminase-like domain-containing protein n=1 Tax=Actinomycetospora lemnae TaxID=3019891 RepID=A0ABT5T0D0_9PSEU|nr:transglutaminase-like domain-containing protein [Actinomycetospora sp. DW7H6]MDD7968579.1 transglutaminase-like domain-containing protein [Actinomycetospora sp. DW7H6]